MAQKHQCSCQTMQQEAFKALPTRKESQKHYKESSYITIEQWEGWTYLQLKTPPPPPPIDFSLQAVVPGPSRCKLEKLAVGKRRNSVHNHMKRVRTSYQCLSCDVGLCPGCFTAYHEAKKIQLVIVSKTLYF